MTKDEMILEILKDAKALLQTHGWCKRYFAVDKDGDPTAVDAPDVAAFCTYGAIKSSNIHLGFNFYLGTSDEVYAVLKKRNGVDWFPSIVDFNDRIAQSKEDVIALFAEAIDNVQTRIAVNACK